MPAALRILVCAWVALWAAAGTARAADAAATRPSVESTPIVREGGPARVGGARGAGGGAGFARTVMALGGVIGLIFVLRYAGRRWFGLPVAGAGGAGPVKVLYRTPVAPRQQLMLVQVGRRIVLVSNTGTMMNTLAEITDPEEMAEVAGEAKAKPLAAASPFAAVFGKAKDLFEGKKDEPEEDEPNVEPVAPEAVNGLLEKVREMQKQFKRA